MRKLVFLVLLTGFAFANSLVLQNGKIQAHTEVFGDSSINPSSNTLESKLEIKDSIQSIKGVVSIQSLSLVSDNKDRDKHMYEVLNVSVNPKIIFSIVSINKDKSGYKINGFLTLNGITKKIKTHSVITQKDKNISINGDFSILLTDFGIEPPSMFFLTVRDQIDINYNLDLLKG